MKTKNMIWAALPMTAALVMTACTSDDNMVETPATPQAELKIIPYTVTVGQGGDAATTRATVESDLKTLNFAAGDKLYIAGEDIKGVLDITGGTGTASATFAGNLTYRGTGSPAGDLELLATLVSEQQTVGTEVSVSSATGNVKVNYPRAAYCDDVATAVQKYSNLTGRSKYGEKSFKLTQLTTFLNFEITFEDGTTAGQTLSAVVNNFNSDICTANVTTKTENEKVVAKFVLPIASGNSLSGAKVTMGTKAALAINDATELTGKVYNVKRTQYRLLSTATVSDHGRAVCAEGHLHEAKTPVPSGCTAVGILGRVTETGHGLILALENAGEPMQDEGEPKDPDWLTINGWISETSYAGTTLKVLPDDEALGSRLKSYTKLGSIPVSNWAVAQKSDYEAIFTNLGSTTGNEDGITFDDNVNAYITGVGGTALGPWYYWSATEQSYTIAWAFSDDIWYWNGYKKNFYIVRPVLAF